MRRDDASPLALRQDALTARAALQRLELRATLENLHHGATSRSGAVVIAMQLARLLASAGTSPAAAGAGPGTRPWMLTAAWLLVRILRKHPAARWLVVAGAAGGAIWWIARAMKTPDTGGDDSG